MGRTACTEPQCLYKGALYLYPVLSTCGCSERDASAGPQEYETLVLTIRLMCAVHTVSTAEFEMRNFQKGLAAILSAFRLNFFT
jgi:hypothetical protein